MTFRIILLSLLLISCSSPIVENSNSKLNLQGGNGGGYEGKVVETYYNWKNDYSCLDSDGDTVSSYDYRVELIENSSSVILSSNLCSHSKMTLDSSLITFIDYNPEVLLFDDKIFQRDIVHPSAGDAFIYCRDMRSNRTQGFDLILRQWDFEYSLDYNPEHFQVHVYSNGLSDIPSGLKMNVYPAVVQSTDDKYLLTYRGMYGFMPEIFEVAVNKPNSVETNPNTTGEVWYHDEMISEVNCIVEPQIENIF